MRNEIAYVCSKSTTEEGRLIGGHQPECQNTYMRDESPTKLFASNTRPVYIGPHNTGVFKHIPGESNRNNTRVRIQERRIRFLINRAQFFSVITSRYVCTIFVLENNVYCYSGIENKPIRFVRIRRRDGSRADENQNLNVSDCDNRQTRGCP